MSDVASFCDGHLDGQFHGFMILVVEDDAPTRVKIIKTLAKHHFETLYASTGEAALALSQSHQVDLILLDIVLPGMDGFEVCRKLRAGGRPMAIIMLTQLDTTVDTIRGLEAGADDYIVKPFVPEELIARIQAVLRRTRELAKVGSTLRFRDLTIEFQSQKCLRNGKDLNLTPKEFALMAVLCSNPGQAVSRSSLVGQVWGHQHSLSDKSLDVYVGRLRQKIKDSQADPILVRSVRGFGYVLD